MVVIDLCTWPFEMSDEYLMSHVDSSIFDRFIFTSDVFTSCSKFSTSHSIKILILCQLNLK